MQQAREGAQEGLTAARDAPNLPAMRYGVHAFAFLFLTASFLAPAARGGERQVPVPLSETNERQIGSRLAARYEESAEPSKDQVVNDYVAGVGLRIARLSDRPDLKYSFRVVRSKEPKAVAFPAGFIYVTTGLLKRIDSEGELAGVLAHEIAHISARHPNRIVEKEMKDAELAAILAGDNRADTTAAGARCLSLLLAGYEKGVEKEADVQALLYVARVGLNPEGMLVAMEKLLGAEDVGAGYWEVVSGKYKKPDERVAQLRSEIKSMGLDAGLPNNQRSYTAVKKRLE